MTAARVRALSRGPGGTAGSHARAAPDEAAARR